MENNFSNPSQPEKKYLYHRVPDEVRKNEEGKDVIYPLNVLKEKFPDLHELKTAKYRKPMGDDEIKNQRRLSVSERIIPSLENTTWGDTLNITAVHPQDIMNALESAGFKPREMKFYQIDPDLLDPSLATIYLYHEEAGDLEDPKEYTAFNKENIGEYSKIPEGTKERYKQDFEKGQKTLVFMGIPHILYKKHLDVSDVEQFPIITVKPKEGK